MSEHGPEWKHKFDAERVKAVEHIACCPNVCQAAVCERRLFLARAPGECGFGAPSWDCSVHEDARRDGERRGPLHAWLIHLWGVRGGAAAGQ